MAHMWLLVLIKLKRFEWFSSVKTTQVQPQTHFPNKTPAMLTHDANLRLLTQGFIHFFPCEVFVVIQIRIFCYF